MTPIRGTSIDSEVDDLRSYIVIGILAMLLLGCTSQPPANNTTAQPHPNATVPANATQPAQPSQPQSLPPDYTVSLGDQVWVNYSVWDNNGTLIDTNDPVLANKSGIYQPSREYAPLNFTVQFNQGIITGVIYSVIGMHVNETEQFVVPPQDAYGPYDPSKVVQVPRFYNLSLQIVVPRSYFVANNLNVTNGTSFQDKQYGTVFISDFNDQNVTVFLISLAGHGTKFTVNGVPLQTVNVVNTTAVVERLLEVNQSYYLPDVNTGAPTYYRVIGKDNSTITLDSNDPRANYTLTFNMTMLKIQHGNLSIGDAG